MKTLPALYILMRTDMASMNAGKAMAQASHASNAFVKEITKQNEISMEIELTNLFETWKTETDQGFGTAIVLGLSMKEIDELFDDLSFLDYKLSTNFKNIVIDPSYPIRDGDVTHHINIPTCAYVFCDMYSDVGQLLKKYNLHP